MYIKVDNNLSSQPLMDSKTINQSSNSNEPIKIEFASYPQNQDKTQAPPKDIDSQLNNVIKNAKNKLGHIPFPFSLFGGDKIKTDATKLLDDPKFRAGLDDILESAAKEPGNSNKNIIELVRDKDTYKKVLDYIKKSSEGSSTLSGILNNSMVEDKLYNYINSDKILVFLS